MQTYYQSNNETQQKEQKLPTLCLQILHAGAPGQPAEQQDRRSSKKLAPVVLDTAQLRVNKRKNLVFYGEFRA